MDEMTAWVFFGGLVLFVIIVVSSEVIARRRVVRPRLVAANVVAYGAIGPIWFAAAVAMGSVVPVVLAVVLVVVVVVGGVRSLQWLRTHTDRAPVLERGEPVSGRLVASYPEELPWYLRRFRFVPFVVEVEITGQAGTSWLPRFRSAADADPRVRVGIPLRVRVLGDQLAIDWAATFRDLPDPVPAGASDR